MHVCAVFPTIEFVCMHELSLYIIQGAITHTHACMYSSASNMLAHTAIATSRKHCEQLLANRLPHNTAHMWIGWGKTYKTNYLHIIL